MSAKVKRVNLKQYRAIRKRFLLNGADGPKVGIVHVHETGACGPLQFSNFGHNKPFSRQIEWDGTNENMARTLAFLLGGEKEDYMLRGIDE
jgi:hypothetical protein